MGMKSRRKGKAFERKLVHALRRLWPKAARGWWQSRGGAEVPDVAGCGCFWIEAGHGDSMDGGRKLAQAVGYARAGVGSGIDVAAGPLPHVTPVAITKRTASRRITVTMRAYDLAELVRAADDAGAAEATAVSLDLEGWLGLVGLAMDAGERDG